MLLCQLDQFPQDEQREEDYNQNDLENAFDTTASFRGCGYNAG